MRKRFCFVLPKFAPENIGGAELQVMYLCQELVNRGYDVHYIREARDSARIPSSYQGIQLHAVPPIRRFFFQWTNAFRLMHQLHRIKPNVVYCRVSKGYLAISALSSLRRRFRLIWACSHDREVAKFRPRTDSSIKRAFERIEQYMFVWALRQATTRLVQTEDQRLALLENYGLESSVLENAHPLPACVEAERLSVVLWIANFRDFKRPDLFLEMARSLRDRKYRFCMIGSIDSVKMNALVKSAAEELPNFSYIGSKSIEEVEHLLWHSRLLVNTSDHEGFPNTYIQALMRGVPIVALNADPNGMIEKYQLGNVSPDFETTLANIDRLMTVPEDWQRISGNCRRFAEQKFSIDRYTDDFLEFAERRPRR